MRQKYLIIGLIIIIVCCQACLEHNGSNPSPPEDLRPSMSSTPIPTLISTLTPTIKSTQNLTPTINTPEQISELRCQPETIKISEDKTHMFYWSEDGKSLYYFPWWQYDFETQTREKVERINPTPWPTLPVYAGHANVGYAHEISFPDSEKKLVIKSYYIEPTPTQHPNSGEISLPEIYYGFYIAETTAQGTTEEYIGKIFGNIDRIIPYPDSVKLLIVMENPRDTTGVWIIDANTQSLEMLTSGYLKGISPDGRWILYSEGNSTLAKNEQTEEVEELPISSIQKIWWLPDEDRFIAVEYFADERNYRVIEFDLRTHQITNLVERLNLNYPWYELSPSYTEFAFIEPDSDILYVVTLCLENSE